MGCGAWHMHNSIHTADCCDMPSFPRQRPGVHAPAPHLKAMGGMSAAALARGRITSCSRCHSWMALGPPTWRSTVGKLSLPICRAAVAMGRGSVDHFDWVAAIQPLRM
jgi:hypothetical protein